jgi:beta-lactamase regulating signal transducer with metallopeptidase domain
VNGASMLVPVADWLCTFALHSTCALGGAWALGCLLGRRAVALQEHVLRFALWVALLSSSLQFFLAGGIWATGLSLPRGPAVVLAESVSLDVAEPMFVLSQSAALPPSSLSFAASGDVSWSIVVVAAAAAFAVLGLGWLWSAHRRLRHVLAQRQPETDPRVLQTAAEVARSLGLRQSPHVSRSPLLATPIAFGWLRPEICLPTRANGLTDASLRAMLAHEVAHLRRCDPAWMWLAAAMQALFPWQVLLVPVRRRWARLVELRCDAIAAEHSSSTAVARCLLDVAEWLRPGTAQPTMALGMAARASSLRERVEAALQPTTVARPERLFAMAWSGLSLAALTVVGPVVQSDAALADVPLLVAVDELAPEFPASPLAVAADLLEAERADLVGEVARLRADLARRPASLEIGLMLAAVERRLEALQRMGARLRARLDRSVPEAR